MLHLPLVGKNTEGESIDKGVKSKDDDDMQTVWRVKFLEGWPKHLK